MLKFLFFVAILTIVSYTKEIAIVADNNFPKDKLTKNEIKELFLGNIYFIDGKRVLVMNYKFNHPMRLCFEKNILQKSQRSLERYWQKAYYQGIRPPKIITSSKMLFLYLDSVYPSIGYVELEDISNKNIKILYKTRCK
jgi:hypothetical protein